jgi:hypothetical protein
MEVILTIKVFNTVENKKFTYEKLYESTIVPRIGERIKDPLFDVSRKVIDAIYDLSNKVCYVVLIDKEVSDNKLCDHLQEISVLHKWIQRPSI